MVDVREGHKVNCKKREGRKINDSLAVGGGEIHSTRVYSLVSQPLHAGGLAK